MNAKEIESNIKVLESWLRHKDGAITTFAEQYKTPNITISRKVVKAARLFLDVLELKNIPFEQTYYGSNMSRIRTHKVYWLDLIQKYRDFNNPEHTDSLVPNDNKKIGDLTVSEFRWLMRSINERGAD